MFVPKRVIVYVLLGLGIALAGGAGYSLAALIMTQPQTSSSSANEGDGSATQLPLPPFPTLAPNTEAALPESTMEAVLDDTATVEAIETETATADSPDETPTTEATQMAEPESEPTAAAFDPNLVVEDTFSAPTSRWPIQDTPTWSAGYESDRYQLQLKGRNVVGLSYPLDVNNYELRADISVDAGAAGLIFLFAEPDTYYQFVIRPNRTFAIQRVDTSAITLITKWTESAALQAGATNQLRIERQGPNVRFFANDQLLTNFSARSTKVTNRYGFGLTDDAGQGRATFDNLVIRRLP